MRNFEQWRAKLAEGKTKIIWELPNNEVIIESKDDITAGDGERRDAIANKATLATQTTSNCFALLNRAGIPNHFVERESDTTFRAKRVDMIPIELVARRIAYGSYLKRNPEVTEGTKFGEVALEFFAKDDANHDPLIMFDFENGVVRRYDPKKPISPESLLDETPLTESPFGVTEEQANRLLQNTIDTFEVLEAAWADQNVTMVDIKIECGFTEDNQLVVADVIDNDSWRIWPGGDSSQMADKQLYRDGHSLDYVADRYAWVAEATNSFAQMIMER